MTCLHAISLKNPQKDLESEESIPSKGLTCPGKEGPNDTDLMMWLTFTIPGSFGNCSDRFHQSFSWAQKALKILMVSKIDGNQKCLWNTLRLQSFHYVAVTLQEGLSRSLDTT